MKDFLKELEIRLEILESKPKNQITIGRIAELLLIIVRVQEKIIEEI